MYLNIYKVYISISMLSWIVSNVIFIYIAWVKNMFDRMISKMQYSAPFGIVKPKSRLILSESDMVEFETFNPSCFCRR